MNNPISFHFISILLTIVNCSKFFTTLKTTSTQKSKTKFSLILIIGITFVSVIITVIIILLLLYIRQRIYKHTKEKVKRKNKEYNIPFETYNNINELDTIQTVGIASEFTDDYRETEVKTII
ncbi:unnamed protein product [Rotaria magnacalcarata]|uniref:Uncharacterized protein n=1 Tax=Rotaria magnacalcarata TaxID=392030 RepID=A0A816SFC3_9BILA|nr:unnamed protein product [Rotaria magnacalcarata]CAF2047612.1 unnamed protein product [Rotaria magnacalcarata]CAF2087558.1 unnamed protein product [Rotaria magnacalcarata]